MKYEQAIKVFSNAKNMNKPLEQIWDLTVRAFVEEIPPIENSFHNVPYSGTITERFIGNADYITRVSDYLTQQGFECQIKPYYG